MNSSSNPFPSSGRPRRHRGASSQHHSRGTHHASVEEPTPQIDDRCDWTADDVPWAVDRQLVAMRRDGCVGVEITDYDSGIWTIRFSQDGENRALLMWAVEVDT